MKVPADEIYAYLIDAMQRGTSPEVIEAEFEAALRFAVQQKKSNRWPDAVSLDELQRSVKEWWQS